MVMPQKVLNQIKWLCKEIPKVEWSGILFYTIEGSIKDPKNLVVHLQDILPMKKGTATYTEYELDDSVVEYMMDNETMEKGWKWDIFIVIILCLYISLGQIGLN